MNKDKLIRTISKMSDQNGNLLLDFMDNYGLPNLATATEKQLEEYIKGKRNGKN